MRRPAAATPLQALEAKLRQRVTGTELALDDLGSGALRVLFEKYLNDPATPRLLIAQPAVGIPGGAAYVLVTGRGASVPFDATSIEARFTVGPDGEARMALIATADLIGWDLGVAFPPLAVTVLSQLSFLAPTTLALATADTPSPEGFWFAGVFNLIGPAYPLQVLFRLGSSTLAIAGPITVLDRGVPTMAPTGATDETVTLGPFTVQPRLTIKAGPPLGDPSDPPMTAIIGSWELPYGGAEPLAVYTRFPFSPLEFATDAGKLARIGMAAINFLAGEQGNLASALPAELPLPSAFTLRQWTMRVNPVMRTIESASITAGMPDDYRWDIVPGVLAVQHVIVGFTAGSDSPPLSALLTGDIVLGPPDKPDVTISILASAPDFIFSGRFVSQVDLEALVRAFHIEVPADMPLPGSLVGEAYVLVDNRTPAFSLSASVRDPDATWRVPVGPTSIGLSGLTVSFERKQSLTSYAIGATLRLGSGPATMSMLASYRTAGWMFSGEIKNETIDLQELLGQFFPVFKDFNPGVIKLTQAGLTYDRATQAYRYTLDGSWQVELGAFVTTVQATVDLTSRPASEPPGVSSVVAADVHERLKGAPEVVQGDRVYQGRVSGTLDLHRADGSVGFTLVVYVDFQADGRKVYGFRYGSDISGEYADDVITLQIGTRSLGDLITLLVAAATPNQDFGLVSPFDLLNSLPLTALTLLVKLKKGQRQIGFQFPSTPSLDFNVGFARVDQISLWYALDTERSPVAFKLDHGRFLATEIENPVGWNVTDPGSTPPVPGGGPFQLNFLAVGQRVRPIAPMRTTTVRDAVQDLAAAFRKKKTEASPLGGTALTYAPDVNWMIAVDAVIANTIALRGIFFDPELYGLSVFVSGPRAKTFANLQFEILYRRINDNLGVYQAELTLPDAMRYLDVGAVSITLPVVRVWVYTDGGFKVDLGFPEGGNFGRSFCLQMLPFVGAGGIYFGVLDGAASTTVPSVPPEQGHFSPVVEFGLGALVGLGRTFDRGIVAGGFALTIQGIVEGTFAYYNPYKGAGAEAFYYRICGKLALVGKVFGVIDFAIVAARIDASITLAVTITVETYRATTLTFTATVSVSVSVRLNLGLFSVTIGFSFSMELSDTFTIGSGSHAPWDPPGIETGAGGTPFLVSLSDDACVSRPVLNWAPVTATPRRPLDLMFAPQVTAASDVEGDGAGPSGARLVAMIYASTEATAGQTLPAFEEIARAVLVWAINALVNGREMAYEEVRRQPIAAGQLRFLYCGLTDPSRFEPFAFDDVVSLLSNLFHVTVRPRTEDEGAGRGPAPENVSVFPIPPVLTLTRPDGTRIDFAAHNDTDRQGLAAIKEYFNQLAARFPSDGQAPRPAVKSADDTRQSIASFMFVDYFALLAKATVQAALDTMRNPTVVVGRDDTLASLAAATHRQGTTPEGIAHANMSRSMRVGCRLVTRDGGTQVQNQTGDTLLGVARRHRMTVRALAHSNAEVTGLFAEGTRILLPSAETMTVGGLLDLMRDQQRFEHLSGMAARVLLQGLRVPWQADGVERLVGLYELSGQQFNAATTNAGESFTLTAPDTCEWLSFDDGRGTPRRLEYTIGPKLAACIVQLKDIELAPVYTTVRLPAFETRRRRFTLANPIVCAFAPPARDGAAAGSDAHVEGRQPQTIWPFPSELQSLLAADPSRQPRMEIVEEASNAPHLRPFRMTPAIDPVHYDYATMLTVGVRPIVSAAEPAKSLASTYDLLGADEAGGERLADLLLWCASRPDAIQQIHVMYPPPPNAAAPPDLVADPIDRLTYFVVQTNLSPASSPPGRSTLVPTTVGGVDPLGMTPLDMLRLLWECSVVRSGGYHLYYRLAGEADDAPRGLPDYVFASNREAQITLLVTYASTDGVAHSFMNAVLATAPADLDRTTVYMVGEDETFTERVSALPAGNIGFAVQRTAPTPSTAQDGSVLSRSDLTTGIEELYNLLTYRIAAGTGFQQSPYGLPLTPAHDSDEEEIPSDGTSFDLPSSRAAWDYRTVIPVFPFALSATDAVRPAAVAGEPVPPPPSGDPYRGVGGTAMVELGWQDIFGNRIKTADDPSARLPVPVQFCDRLISVGEWPAVVTSYRVRRDKAGPALVLAVRFDTNRYDPARAPDYRARAEADRRKLASVYYQVSAHVTWRLTATLDPRMQVPADLGPELVRFLVDAYDYLGTIGGVPAAPPAIGRVFVCPVADTSGLDVFPLRVTLGIDRASVLVDRVTANPATDPIESVQTDIAPEYLPAPADSSEGEAPPTTLQVFATELQTCFPALAVATGRGARQDAAGTDPAVWVVRFGDNGFRYTLQDDPRYFALAPLARVPLSIADVTILQYTSGTPFGQASTAQSAFGSVNLDLLAREYLAAVDLFLTPDYIVPAWRLLFEGDPPSPNPVQRILEAKITLARAIAARVAAVYAEQTGEAFEAGRVSACGALAQQLLTRLSTAYQIDAFVQLPAAVESPFTDLELAPRLYIRPAAVSPVGDDGRSRYSLSSATLTLAQSAPSSPSSFVNVGVTVSADARQDQAVLPLDLTLSVSNFEFDRRPVPGIEGYVDSSWLSFVLPLDRGAGARAATYPVGVPLPLLAFPTPPTLVKQTGAPIAVVDSLAATKKWDFAFEYSYAGAVQDTVHGSILYNLEPALPRSAADAFVSLLLQFNAAWPGIRADLDAQVLRPGGVRAIAINAMEWLATFTESIAAAWPGPAPAVHDAPASFEDRFVVREKAVDLPDNPNTLIVEVTRSVPLDVPIPLVGISDFDVHEISRSPLVAEYVYEDFGFYLTYDERMFDPKRTLTVGACDIFQIANASAGAWVARNENFGRRQGNEAFIYRTPTVRYITPAVPLLQSDLTIDMAASAAHRPAPLDVLLRDFLDACFHDPIPPGPHAGDAVDEAWPARTMRIACFFGYVLAPAAELDVELPILMTAPLDLSPSSAAVGEIAASVRDWVVARDLMQRDGARLRWDISLFAGAGSMQLPIWRVANARLSAADVIWS